MSDETDDTNWFIKKKLDSYFNLRALGKYADATDEKRAIARLVREAVQHDRRVRSE